jgi:hypothetical protein
VRFVIMQALTFCAFERRWILTLCKMFINVADFAICV